MRIGLLIIIGLLYTTAVQSAEPVQSWQGRRATVQTQHLLPALKGGEGYGDKYTFNAEFGARGSLYVSLTIANLGFGDHKMEAKGRLTLDGKTFRWNKKLDDDEWSSAKGRLNIQAGPVTLSGTPERLTFDVKSGSNELQMVFTPIAQPWRPGSGRVVYGSERKVSDYTVFPLCKVQGTVTMEGARQELSGIGYGTRSWSELAIYEQARWTLEFRGISEDRTVYLRELSPSADYARTRIAYLLVTKGSEILFESFDYTFTPTSIFSDSRHENGYRVPESFTIVAKDVSDPARLMRGKFTKKRLRKRTDELTRMNAALRMIVRRFSKPVSYAYETDFLVEVKHTDGVEQISGTGRYEVTHLNR